LDGVVEIAGGEVLVLKGHGILLCSSEVLDSLIRLEMVFNVVDLALGVNPFESMRRISIHKPIPVWSSSVGEKNPRESCAR
jgi:hypothetical protein